MAVNDICTTVIYNGDCPICSREIAGYRNYSEARGLDILFDDLNTADLTRWGLTPDQAARRLYVVRDGVLYDGVAAFALLWEAMPRFRLLARLVRLPGVRRIAATVYDRLLAPLLYGMHRRRRAKALGNRTLRG
ncbi:MAG: DUF393 domain-containing protein [Rhodobacter sp.]|nr:DUF393 domain-containing protein [Rhodobacter sp.]